MSTGQSHWPTTAALVYSLSSGTLLTTWLTNTGLESYCLSVARPSETGMNQDATIERLLDVTAKYLGIDRSRCRKCRPATRSGRGAPHRGDNGEQGTTLPQRTAD